jgi:oligoribonuclease
VKIEKALVWIDLEMTGLDPTVDLILEISVAVTDSQLNKIADGPTLVIAHERLPGMNVWVKEQHTKSGLLEQVQKSIVTTKNAEDQMLEFVKKYCNHATALLCGNTIWQDRFFLRMHMPTLENCFHYRMIDVSTIKELVRRWYPNNPHAMYQKKDAHRALDDVHESIDELRHYRTYFFIPT